MQGLAGVGLRCGLDLYSGCMQPVMAQGLGCWQSLDLMKMERAPECLQPPSAEDQAWALSWLPRLSGGGMSPRFSNPQGPLPIRLSHSLSHPQDPCEPRLPWRKDDQTQGLSRHLGVEWVGGMPGIVSSPPPNPWRYPLPHSLYPLNVIAPLRAWQPFSSPSHLQVGWSPPSSAASPCSLPSTLYHISGRVPPIHQGVEVLHQCPADALVVGTHGLCILPISHLGSAPLQFSLFFFPRSST